MKIAVDVTPILPGGECGGARQLVIELLKGLGKKAVRDKFMLLTADYNDEIFKEFDGLEMKRVCVRGEPSQERKSGWRVFCGMNRPVFRRLRRDGFWVPKVLSVGWRVFEKSKRLLMPRTERHLLRSNGVSVLFCPMTAPVYHEEGVPTVSVVYDLQHLYYPSFFSVQELAWRSNFYDELKKKADHIICISSFTRKTVVENLDVPPDRTCVIPVCVQSRMVVPSSEWMDSVLTRFDLEGEKYCIYPANLWPHKNHKMLLVGFNIFTKKHPSHHLHLVLTGADLKRYGTIKAAVKQMGLEDRVHFLGYLKEEELSAIWHRSHFLIFPSLFEGFGIPLVEAMRCGKPILASNVTSIPEVAGDAAIYFDPKKVDEMVGSLSKIMEDEGLYHSLVAKGQERLRYYDFDHMVDEYIRVIHQAGDRVR
jgi:glycosyltransferase involved in cell wall biosynthesis